MSFVPAGSHIDMLSKLDSRFSDPEADATPWEETERALREAELYWLTTVRADGRPHVTPLIAVLHDGTVHFCTGIGEQKARNLEHSNRIALTTGTNTWARGLDVVVEGLAVQITDDDALRRLADAYVAKYGEFWRFEVRDGAFRNTQGEDPVPVFRVEPSKVIAFAKDPHAQTTYRF
jgi:nitroimidazol reductase NimA-like FMN-containing flavoprotein (pyridoxamine 5'-phosphate oxidase superfamily)